MLKIAVTFAGKGCDSEHHDKFYFTKESRYTMSMAGRGHNQLLGKVDAAIHNVPERAEQQKESKNSRGREEEAEPENV